MLISRIDDRTLGVLCERIGVAFEVGHDPYRIFEREAGNEKDAYAGHMKAVAECVRNGSTLAEAVERQGNYFPPNFVNFIEVGEKTGRLERVLARMADYYKNLAHLRSTFVGSIIWPLVQLVIGLIVVSVLIYMPVIMADMQVAATGEEADEVPDLLGLGLVGWRGLAILWTGVLAIAAALAALFVLVRNGKLSFIPAALARVPLVGNSLRTFDEAAFVQTLAMAIESGVSASESIALAFKTCGSGLFRSKAEQA
jgi:type II secretory pathway component PulF